MQVDSEYLLKWFLSLMLYLSTDKWHSPPQSFQREKKEKEEVLLHNLSKSGQIGPQVALFQIIIIIG